MKLLRNRTIKGAVGAMLLTLTFATVMFHPSPATSWVPETSGSNSTNGTRLRWPGNVSWVVNPSVSGRAKPITGAQSVTSVISQAFSQWTSAPNTSIPLGSIGTTTGSTAINSNDNQNLICFVCTPSGGFGKDAIAVTITSFDNAGNMVDADMAFNPNTAFITDPVPAQDPTESLQTVATHEFGHFLGLDHSAVVRAVMNPFAPSLLLTLSYDDVAGISTDYPAPGFSPLSISGTVVDGNNSPIFGAHVFAESATAETPFPAVRKSPISAITDSSGKYTISGVPQDQYTVTAEPLNDPVNNTNFTGSPAFATNFTTRQH